MNSDQRWQSFVPRILGSLIVITLLWLYWPVFVKVFKELYDNEDYSFGLLLPFVSGYIVYLKWTQIRGRTCQPSWWGSLFIVLGFTLYVLGKLVTDRYTPPFSFVIILIGLLLLLGGWGLVRLLGFPLLLLVLMIPLPSLVIAKISGPLQLISSQLATAFLQAVGLPVVRQGNVIDLGVRQLQVVAACSGLRYILSLLALGLIFCYFYQRRPWKAAILIISFIPLAILANTMRVAGMGIYPSLQEGFLHTFTGWLIFLFCFGCFGLLNWLLNHWWPPIEATTQFIVDGPKNFRMGGLSLTPYMIGALLLIIAGGVATKTVAQPSPVPLLQSFDQFPLQLGSWQGRRTYIDPKIFEKTDADSYLDAEFTVPGTLPVSLYIAHYEIQASAGGLGHNPGVCMTGSGWETLGTGTTEVAPGLPVNYLLLQREGVRLLVYWWNIHQGQWLALDSARIYKVHTILTALRTDRTDWALIRLVTPLNYNLNAAQDRLAAFARLVAPVLPQFIQAQVKLYDEK